MAETLWTGGAGAGHGYSQPSPGIQGPRGLSVCGVFAVRARLTRIVFPGFLFYFFLGPAICTYKKIYNIGIYIYMYV